MAKATKQKKVVRRERAFCAWCKKKRYIDTMDAVFIHPVACPGGVYSCKGTFKEPSCTIKVLEEIVMYAETGLLSITINPLAR